jgi:type IV fimbrial biogenesis protein FimT
MQTPKQQKVQGFTLLELLIGISIAGVIVAFALPSLRDFTASNSVSAGTNQMVSALNFARTQAITLRTPVTLCASANYYTYSASHTAPTCSGSAFEKGWVIYVGTSGPTATASTTNILKAQAPDTSGKLTINGAAIGTNISFNSVGTTTNTGNLIVCGNGNTTNASKARVIQIGAGGRIQSMTGDTSGSGFSSC